MGTHPIFESDFDCLTEQVGSNMSEEFDFTKKKKKSKKMPIEIEGEDNREALDEQANEDLFGQEAVDPAKLDDDLDLTKKKKKKKKKGELDLEDDGENDMAGEFDELSLDKKKKKKKNVDFTEAADEVEVDETKPESERPWLDRDLDKEGYLYKELLERVFKIIKSKNPEGTGARQKIVMQPPKLARIGTKKTCFTNFAQTAKLLNRKSEHLMMFIFAELGTTGNQDAGGQLILKGKYQSKAMEKVLKQYCKDFVQCKTCKSYETTLDKRDRLFFILCKDCQSERSVQAITKGFQAITNKRSRIRNAAAAATQK